MSVCGVWQAGRRATIFPRNFRFFLIRPSIHIRGEVKNSSFLAACAMLAKAPGNTHEVISCTMPS